ncbi:YuiB family protein [Bacillus daqingensis]|uniref:YuiB family protein n=1 Tax=Bacillus daqingensis TaxID=872396 RepID=A0ABV9NZ21_9BACI
MLSIPQLIIAVLLYFVLFFGIGFILNMLLRSTWVMAVLYPLVIIFLVTDIGFFSVFTSPVNTFSNVGSSLASLAISDIVILSAGMIGAILAGIAIRMLRVRGYQMF